MINLQNKWHNDIALTKDLNQNVNTDNATVLPIMLSIELLPEMELKDTFIKWNT